MLMLDCGRRMRSQDGDLSHFDHALNASLLLCRVAARRCGACTFASHAQRLCRQRRASNNCACCSQPHDLQPTQQPADYSAAVEQCWHASHAERWSSC